MAITEPDEELHQQVSIAIRAVRNQIRLPLSATLLSYETIIRSVVWDGKSEVYLYRWRNTATYPTIVGEFEGVRWLVMFGLDGIMETAFPPTDAEEYLSDSRFAFLGLVQEISE